VPPLAVTSYYAEGRDMAEPWIGRAVTVPKRCAGIMEGTKPKRSRCMKANYTAIKKANEWKTEESGGKMI